MSQEASTMDTEDQTPTAPPTRPGRWRQVLLGIVILLCGMVIGASGAIVLGKDTIIRRLLRPDRMPGDVASRMTATLDLSPEQAQQVEQIIDKHMRIVREIRTDSRERAHEELQSMRDEVAAALDEEQARQWRKQFHRFERLRPRPPPHARPGGPERAAPRRGPPDTRHGAGPGARPDGDRPRPAEPPNPRGSTPIPHPPPPTDSP